MQDEMKLAFTKDLCDAIECLSDTESWDCISGDFVLGSNLPDDNQLNILFLNVNGKQLEISKKHDTYVLSELGQFRMNEYKPLTLKHKVYGVVPCYQIKYIRTDAKHGEYVYLEELNDIMKNGKGRPDRTGVGTLSVFGRQLHFDISKSIPVLTTKFVSLKSVIMELLWFLKGCTDSKTLEKENVNIWKLNTTQEFLTKRGLDYREGDTGPMYGFVWRHAGAEYRGCDANYTNEGYDQFIALINGLKKDPYSRRHIMSTFSPQYIDQGVLIPCHGIVTQMHVEEEDGKLFLSCHTYCRSQDTFLGQPFNIASYAILTHLIAKICDMEPRELIISTGDTHIYKNHIHQVHEQSGRQPLPFPMLRISDDVKQKSIDDIQINDFEVIGYMHHPSIKAEMAV